MSQNASSEQRKSKGFIAVSPTALSRTFSGDSAKSSSRKRSQRGYVLVLMTFAAVALVGAVGIAVDTGMLFVAKSETQAYVDAGALAAAMELNGTADGLAAARAAVLASSNTWRMNTRNVNTAVVEFSKSSAGPWELNPLNPAGYIYSRVRLTVSSNLYFMPAITRAFSQNVVSKAIAGQIDISSFRQGASPYSLVSTNTTGPYFGLTPGNTYTIQWPSWNGNNPQCKPNKADQCYVKPPCGYPGSGYNNGNDPSLDASAWAASQNWGADTNGYWGYGSSSEIREAVLDGQQGGRVVAVGDNVDTLLTNGNMASQAGILDERVNQDGYQASNTVSNYLSASTANGRRLMLVPILNPQNANRTIVSGWGVVLLYTNGTPSNYYDQEVNGVRPFCAVYVGPYSLGSNNQGAGGTTGASRVKLVD